MFQGYMKEVQREFQGRVNFKGGTRKIERYSQRPRKFQGHLKKVSSVFQGNSNNKFQGCFQNVSMKFYFCSFVLACISSQLPEQKEGLFTQGTQGKSHQKSGCNSAKPSIYLLYFLVTENIWTLTSSSASSKIQYSYYQPNIRTPKAICW